MSQLVAIITNFLSSISTIALPLLALDIIVSGIALIIPSQKYRGVAVGFLVFGIVGFILVMGASTFSDEINDTVKFSQVIFNQFM